MSEPDLTSTSPKNFDEERPRPPIGARTFVLRGEEFVVRAGVRPEVLAEYAVDADTLEATLAQIDTVMEKLLEPGESGDAYQRYLAVRAQDDWPLSIHDMRAVMQWIFEVHTLRPTSPSGNSSSGPAGTGTRSKAASSTPPVVTSPA